ncbi:MAG: hypothetical protein ACO1RT_04755 [Planctomycetaceae bacterium]
MTLIGFADRRVAEKLRDMAGLPPQKTPNNRPNSDSESWIFRTPEDGIGAFADAEPYDEQDLPTAECEAWVLYKTDDGKVRRKQAKNIEGENLMILVANMLPEAIPGDTWIGASRFVGGVYLADWAPCS